MTPTWADKPRHTDTQPDLSFKCVFCNYLYVVGTNVGCGPARFCFFVSSGFVPSVAGLKLAMALS